jgi:hypothetical protein
MFFITISELLLAATYILQSSTVGCRNGDPFDMGHLMSARRTCRSVDRSSLMSAASVGLGTRNLA